MLSIYPLLDLIFECGYFLLACILVSCIGKFLGVLGWKFSERMGKDDR